MLNEVREIQTPYVLNFLDCFTNTTIMFMVGQKLTVDRGMENKLKEKFSQFSYIENITKGERKGCQKNTNEICKKGKRQYWIFFFF